MLPEVAAPPKAGRSIADVFAAQRAFAPQLALTSANDRIQKLKRLRAWVFEHQTEVEQALYDDLRRAPTETVVAELLSVNAEITHVIKHLKGWMKPRRVSTPMSMLGTSAYVKYEPKGNILIISPWNYPFNLTVKPLAMAIAAGCTAVLKPSENTPHTSALLGRMVAELFEVQEVALFEGDAAVAGELLALPFNHIYFTGSPAVGKIVMEAAAQHLASVTLELGGKSPCIVDETADLQKVAERVAWGKFFNNGQTCIAPDYLLVQETVKTPFLEKLRASTERMYNADGKGFNASPDYCRIVNRRHFNRVRALLDDAVAQGARVEMGGQTDETQNFIAPTVLTGVNDAMRVMREEIFGPVFPVLTFNTREEVVQRIRSGEKPLALYIGSQSREAIDYYLDQTSSGGAVVNETLIQFGHTGLPWGGVNNSGVGKAHGHWGFLEFCNQRGVLRQHLGGTRFLYPPYTPKVRRVVNWVLKWI